MKDLASKMKKKLTLEELRAFGKEEGVVYNIVMVYDTNSANHSEIITATDIDVAIKIMKQQFIEESKRWIEDNYIDEEDVQSLIESELYVIKDVHAWLCVGDEYLNSYITANKVVTSI